MKFFANQKVDQVGITAVALQKILLFLMILSLFSIFNGGFFSFLLCMIGFIGAYKRRPGLLTAYVSISVILIVVCFFIALSGIFMMSSSDDYVYDYSSESSSSSSVLTGPQPAMSKLKAVLNFARGAIGSEEKSSEASSESSSISSEEKSSSSVSSSNEASDSLFNSLDSSSYYYEDDVTGIIFLSIVVLVIGFFLAYLKIYSLVLAWRLRKMIFAAATALPIDTPQTHEFAPANTSCAVPEEHAPAPMSPFQPAPFFAPGFAPYPYAMPMGMMPPQGQQFPGQFPHHVMFGQQPVFYTYAPMPQSEEKQ